jgi:hypothetical protein
MREPSEMVKAVESVLKKVNEPMLNCSLPHIASEQFSMGSLTFFRAYTAPYSQ